MPQPFPSPPVLASRPDGSLLVTTGETGHEQPLALLWPDAAAAPEPHAPLTAVRSPAAGGMTPWMAPARADWARRADLFESASLASGATPAILPHHADVISDIPSVLTFLRARPSWGLVLCPRWLITPEMDPCAPDHLLRIGDTLGAHPSLRGILLTADRWNAGTIAAWTRPPVWTACMP